MRRAPRVISVVCMAVGLALTSNLAGAQLRVGGEPIVLPAVCLGGSVVDDGTVESGYSWVPSVVEGQYVQAVDPSDLGGRNLDEVCVCWFRTERSGDDDTIEFEVVGYGDNGGEPGGEPLFAVPATVTIETIYENGGAVVAEVAMPGNRLPVGTSYLGVRWNASVDEYFFVCSDQSAQTEPVPGFFIDDRAKEWGNVHDTNDPIFDEHRAFVIRPRGSETLAVEIPTLGTAALSVFAIALAALAGYVSRARS